MSRKRRSSFPTSSLTTLTIYSKKELSSEFVSHTVINICSNNFYYVFIWSSAGLAKSRLSVVVALLDYESWLANFCSPSGGEEQEQEYVKVELCLVFQIEKEKEEKLNALALEIVNK